MLEAEFETACRSAIDESRLLGYDPTAWTQMIERHGAAQAAVKLVTSGDVQSGFSRLVARGRPDLTIEAAVLDPAWRPLFRDPAVRDAARWRLEQAGHHTTPD